VVVELVQDLDVAPRTQAPMGDVRLPALVGLVGLEADDGAPGPRVRLRGDEAPTVQDPPDGGDRWSVTVASFQLWTLLPGVGRNAPLNVLGDLNERDLRRIRRCLDVRPGDVAGIAVIVVGFATSARNAHFSSSKFVPPVGLFPVCDGSHRQAEAPEIAEDYKADRFVPSDPKLPRPVTGEPDDGERQRSPRISIVVRTPQTTPLTSPCRADGSGEVPTRRRVSTPADSPTNTPGRSQSQVW
jgi:hypothetical protein